MTINKAEFIKSRPKYEHCQSRITEDKELGIHHIEQDLNLIASFAQPGDTKHNPFTWSYITGGGITATSKYFGGKNFNSVGEAINYFEKDWKFPTKLMEEAKSLACELIYVLQSDNNPRVSRKLDTGKLDMTAMNRVMRDIQLGRFSPEQTRPFKKRLKGSTSRPSVAVVIEGNYRFMWAKDENIPNCVVAGMAISWAAQALDCKVNTFISNSCTNYGKPPHALHMKIFSDDDSIPIHKLGAVLHRDLFRCATSNAAVHHPDTYKFFDTDGNHTSGETCHGLTYAKKYYNSNILIGVGNHKDAHLANAIITDLSSTKKIISKVAELLSANLKVAA